MAETARKNVGDEREEEQKPVENVEDTAENKEELVTEEEITKALIPLDGVITAAKEEVAEQTQAVTAETPDSPEIELSEGAEEISEEEVKTQQEIIEDEADTNHKKERESKPKKKQKDSPSSSAGGGGGDHKQDTEKKAVVKKDKPKVETPKEAELQVETPATDVKPEKSAETSEEVPTPLRFAMPSNSEGVRKSLLHFANSQEGLEPHNLKEYVAVLAIVAAALGKGKEGLKVQNLGDGFKSRLHERLTAVKARHGFQVTETTLTESEVKGSAIKKVLNPHGKSVLEKPEALKRLEESILAELNVKKKEVAEEARKKQEQAKEAAKERSKLPKAA